MATNYAGLSPQDSDTLDQLNAQGQPFDATVGPDGKLAVTKREALSLSDYDWDGARNAGVPEREILDFLNSSGALQGYDLTAARKAGVADVDIVDFLKPKPPEKQPEQSGWRRAADVGISAVKSAIAVPEAVVGLADIPTMGYAGKAAEAIGFRPKEAKAALDDLLSDKQKAANKAVEDAKGFFPTIGAALQNPSVIGHSVIESAGLMGAGGVVGRGLSALVSPVTAAAMGEGVVGAGAAAEQIRQETKDGLLTPFQGAAAIGSGIGTSVFGAIGGKLSQKLGITDVDTYLATGKIGETNKGIIRRIVEGGISEGVFEELPQSVQEQMWQNAALNRPLMQGVPEGAAMGLLAGAAMGGGFGILSGPQRATPEADPTKLADQETQDTDPIKSAGPILAAPDVDTAIAEAFKSAGIRDLQDQAIALDGGDNASELVSGNTPASQGTPAIQAAGNSVPETPDAVQNAAENLPAVDAAARTDVAQKTPPIVRFREEAKAIEAQLPPAADGYIRMWRGNRDGEVGTATRFTNDLAGIALPFRDAYKGQLSYVDIKAEDASKYLQTGTVATGAEFILPPDLSKRATSVAKLKSDVAQKAGNDDISAGRGAAGDILTAANSGVSSADGQPSIQRGESQTGSGPDAGARSAGPASSGKPGPVSDQAIPNNSRADTNGSQAAAVELGSVGQGATQPAGNQPAGARTTGQVNGQPASGSPQAPANAVGREAQGAERAASQVQPQNEKVAGENAQTVRPAQDRRATARNFDPDVADALNKARELGRALRPDSPQSEVDAAYRAAMAAEDLRESREQERKAPKFVDYAEKKGKAKGEIKFFSNASAALKYKGNKKIRGYAPRETADGWVLSKPFKPRSEKQLANDARKKAKTEPIDILRDELQVALRKMGGIDIDEALASGFDKADIARANIPGFGNRKLFRKGGMSLDAAREAIAQGSEQAGYLDPNQADDLNHFIDRLMDSVKDQASYYSFAGQEYQLAMSEAAKEADRGRSGVQLDREDQAEAGIDSLPKQAQNEVQAAWASIDRSMLERIYPSDVIEELSAAEAQRRKEQEDEITAFAEREAISENGEGSPADRTRSAQDDRGDEPRSAGRGDEGNTDEAGQGTRSEVKRKGGTPLTDAQQLANTLAGDAAELGMQIRNESEESDFDPTEVSQAVANWADGKKYSADDLRQAVIKDIAKRPSFDGKTAILRELSTSQGNADSLNTSPERVKETAESEQVATGNPNLLAKNGGKRFEYSPPMRGQSADDTKAMRMVVDTMNGDMSVDDLIDNLRALDLPSGKLLAFTNRLGDMMTGTQQRRLISEEPAAPIASQPESNTEANPLIAAADRMTAAAERMASAAESFLQNQTPADLAAKKAQDESKAAEEKRIADLERDQPLTLQGQDTSAERIEREKRDSQGTMFDRKAADKITDSAGFKNWLGNATLVRIDETHEYKSGEPVVVEGLHGTTSDFTVFNRGKSSVESDLGAGFYITNTREDVGTNYAGLGPDLTGKVERTAERYEQMLEDEDWAEGKSDKEIKAEAMRRARADYMNNEGFTMPVFVKFENPVVLGGKGETFLDMTEDYNEETEEYGEPTGKLVDLVDALRNTDTERFGDANIEQAISDLFDAASGDEGLQASDVIRILAESEGLQYATDYEGSGNGDMASKEIIRQAFKEAGFDGFIDQTPYAKFGPRKIKGAYSAIPVKGMDGITPDTVHFVAFEPNQIKSAIGNRGTFDPNNPDIRFSRGGIWKSQMSDAIGTLMANQEPAKALSLKVEAWAKAGKFKQDELTWSGLSDWLKTQEGKVTKQQVQDFIRENGVQVEEVTLEDSADKTGETAFRRQLLEMSRADLLEEAELRGIYMEAGNRADIIDAIINDARQGDDDTAGSNDPTKFSQYQLPGGENYRELLLTLPGKRVAVIKPVDRGNDENGRAIVDVVDENGKVLDTFSTWSDAVDYASVRNDRAESSVNQFRSSHFDQPNILAHIRFNERTDAEGRKTLFIEEIQSDWAQKGRKEGFAKRFDTAGWKAERDNDGNGWRITNAEGGYEGRAAADTAANAIRQVAGVRGAGTPSAPFVHNTTAWTSLAMKRMVKYAIDNGFDKIAWTNGEQQAERYKLSKQVDRINWSMNGTQGRRVLVDLGDYGTAELLTNGDGMVVGVRGGNNALAGAKEKNISDVLGKGIADKIFEVQEGELSGEGLNIGGEGMRGYYDKIIPSVANDLLKKLGGGKVETVTLGVADGEKYPVTRAAVSGVDEWRVWDADDNVIARYPTEGEARAKAGKLAAKSGVELFEQMGFTITDKMRESAQGGLPLFARNQKQAQSIQASDARAAAEVITKKWKNAPKITVHESLTSDSVPAGLRSAMEKEGVTDARGAWYAGAIELFPSNIGSLAELERTIVHEARHYGLEGLFGKDMNPILMEIYMKDKGVRTEANRLVKTLKVSTVDAVNETLANMPLDAAKKLPGWQKLIAKLKAWLNDRGFTNLAKMLEGPSADAITKDILYQVEQFVKTGKRGDTTFTTTLFSKKGNQRTINPNEFPTNEENRQYTDRLEKALRQGGDNFTATPVLPQSEANDAGARGDNAGAGDKNIFRLAEKVAGVFGKQVVWMRADGDFSINGVMTPRIPNKIFIDVRAKAPVYAVMGHELAHWIEFDAPATYAQLMRAMDKVLIKHEQYRVRNGLPFNYSKDQISKEMVGDLMGDAFATPQFWKNLAQENPGLIRGIANKIMQWLNNAIAKFSKGFGSDAYVNDLKVARHALAQAVAEYALLKKGATPSDATGEYSKAYSDPGDPQFHRAFHGSPHDHDGFSLDKIGTGEGAQAYGYGLYFASNREVADHYKRVLSSRGMNSLNDKFDRMKVGDRSVTSFDVEMREEFPEIVATRDKEAINRAIDGYIAGWNKLQDDATYPFRDYAKDHAAAWKNLKTAVAKDGITSGMGAVYEVELAPKQEDYLDWDKPLSEQSEKVRDALDKWLGEYGADGVTARSYDPKATGEDIYDDVVGTHDDDKQAASAYLKSIGIPGIRYLDGSSRSKGEGNHNFVIFSADDISIVAKFSRSGDSTPVQNKRDSLIGNAKLLADVGKAPAFIKHGFSSLDTPSKRLMLHSVFAMGQDLKVREAIIKAIPVDMMDVLRAKQLSPQVLFHDESVLFDLFSVNGNVPVSMTANAANAAVRMIATAATKQVNASFPHSGRTLNGDAAVVADVGSHTRIITQQTFDDKDVSIVAKYSRTDQTESPAFKKWFGNSAVVDSNGKPLVVYHATNADIGEFNRAFLGGNNRQVANDQLGFWFADNADSAGSYLFDNDTGADFKPDSNIVPAYLSITKPYRMTADEFYSLSKKGNKTGKQLFNKLEQQGYDGVVAETGEGAAYAAFKPEQIKSAIGNNGDFSPSNPDIRYSRTAADAPKKWDSPEPSKMDSILYKLADKQIDLKRVTEAVRDGIGEILETWDAYLKETLFHGRSAKRVATFAQKELKPLLNDMQLRGVTIPELETYLHNRHAEERNKQVAKINPKLPDRGSGITTKDARAYLAGLTTEQRTKYEALAKKVDAITKGTRQTLQDYGLMSTAEMAQWEGAYKHYVPLMKDTEVTGQGEGFSIRGDESKRALGDGAIDSNILANLMAQRERAIVRGEKNRVALSLYGLAKLNPNEDFWSVDNPPIIRRVVKLSDKIDRRTIPLGMDIPENATEVVVEGPDPMFLSRENVIVTKYYNPKTDTVTEKAIVFNEDNPRAVRMAAALKNLDADQMGEIMNTMAKATRFLASVNTQYNPIFGLVNLTRDVQGAVLNLTSTELAGKQKQVLSLTPKALAAVYMTERNARKGREPKGEWGKLYDEFQNVGAQTGYRDLFTSSQDRADALQREIDKITEGKVKQAGRAIFDWLSDYNQAMENSVRLAAYKVGLDQGLSKEAAANVAKNLTVNFNRKGQITQQAGALYAFFNASVQGTARLAQTLKGPAGKRILIGGLILGALQAMMLAGFDEDEPPQFERERNLIIPIGGKSYVKIPMPLGLHVIPNISRILIEMGIHGKPMERLFQLMSVAVDAFNPVGAVGLSAQTFTPTVADPFVALGENRDWTGKPIAREDFSSLNPTPGHSRSKDTASIISKTLSEGLNWLSGGTEYTKGKLSPTPDQLDYLFGQVGGGVWREGSKFQQSISSGFTGEELPPYKIPVIGRFYGSTGSQASKSALFYRNLKQLNAHEAEIEGRQKAGQDPSDYIRDNPDSELYQAANRIEREISKRMKQKRQMVKDNAPKSEVKDLENEMAELMHEFNQEVAARRGK